MLGGFNNSFRSYCFGLYSFYYRFCRLPVRCMPKEQASTLSTRESTVQQTIRSLKGSVLLGCKPVPPDQMSMRLALLGVPASVNKLVVNKEVDDEL